MEMEYEKLRLTRRTEHMFWIGNANRYMLLTIRIWDGRRPQFMFKFK